MAISELSDMVFRLGQGLLAPAGSDADLLARFLGNRDEQAFTLLVRRHGPMVFGVCRRVTGNHHLAEDAFQAVFVVLAAKAGSVRPRTALPAWLYGVAYRTALRARTMNDRRRRREAPVETLREPAFETTDPVESSDVVAILDEEIARLPERMREPVVLCELVGRSRQEAAGQLGIPEGTLSSRLAAARKALAVRLRQRGIALSAAALSAALSRVVSASVPADLTARAVAAAITPNLVPAPVAVLSHGVLRTMFAQKLKLIPVALGLFASVVFAGGLLLAADPPAVHEPPPKPAVVLVPKPAVVLVPKPVAAPKSLPKGSNKILFFSDGKLMLIDPDGKNAKRFDEKGRGGYGPLDAGGPYHPNGANLSPDGKRFAALLPPADPPMAGRIPTLLHVRGLNEKGPGTDLGVECQWFCWSPDGTEIAFCDSNSKDGPPEKLSVTHGIVNVKTKEKTLLKLPADHFITDWSRDGKFFLTSRYQEKRPPRLYLMNRDGTEHKAVTDGKDGSGLGRLSPNGRRVLYMEMHVSKDASKVVYKLIVVDVTTGKATPVEGVPLNANIKGFCWSPDGKTIAYAWREIHARDPKDVPMMAVRPRVPIETESFLVVCDPDGKNQKTIATEKGSAEWLITIGHLDWGFVADDEGK
jgi:RNA polymerase sigma factor (sigma-70 family)